MNLGNQKRNKIIFQTSMNTKNNSKQILLTNTSLARHNSKLMLPFLMPRLSYMTPYYIHKKENASISNYLTANEKLFN